MFTSVLTYHPLVFDTIGQDNAISDKYNKIQYAAVTQNIK